MNQQINSVKTYRKANRKGVTVVLFAILLPVLLLLAMIAVNIAHMQLTRTELKIATDAAARAGGQAWSEFNDLDQAKDFARQAAELNTVSGKPLILSTEESAGQMVFGESVRDGADRFVFTAVSESEFASGSVLASGFQVNASHETALLFEIDEIDSFAPHASSTVSQVERDIALVLDRSGSMFSFEGQVTNPGQGEDFLFNTMTALFEDPANDQVNEITREDYINSIAEYQSLQETNDMSPDDRFYTDRILDLLSGDLLVYASSVNTDYHNGIRDAPRFSRWHGIEIACDAFFDVLESTVQMELVSVVSFASDSRVEADLSADIEALREIAPTIKIKGGTHLGEGMKEGFASLNVPTARLGAIKTVIVLTDGISSGSPSAAAREIIADNPSTIIHTVTFGAEADIVEMAAVARIGSGKHYHATNTAELVKVFRILAGTHRTLITQ